MSASGEPAEGFDYGAVEERLGESAEGRLADAINAAAAARGRKALDLVGEVRAMVERERMREHARAIAECEATLRVVILDIEARGELAAREATYYRLAFGMREASEESMRRVAAKWGVSVEAVSKAVKAIRDRHGAVLNTFNKTAVAASKYRETNYTRRKTL